MNGILVIDDSSIKYCRKQISVDYNYYPGIDELFDIFKEDKSSIYRYNTKNCISVILKNNTEVLLHELSDISIKPIFLKITNDELKKSDNEILLTLTRKKHYMKKIEWMSDWEAMETSGNTINKETVINDLDGYCRCMEMLELFKDKNYQLPAIEYCTNLHMHAKNAYTGYLPSIGQLLILLKYIEMINYILTGLHQKPINLQINDWWSANQWNNANTYMLHFGNVLANVNTAKFNILPLFKKQI